MRALEAAGYSQLDDLTRVTEKELLALHGIGPKGIRMLNAELAKRGQAIGSALQDEATDSFGWHPVTGCRFQACRSTTV